jgi:hypothetical protein
VQWTLTQAWVWINSAEWVSDFDNNCQVPVFTKQSESKSCYSFWLFEKPQTTGSFDERTSTELAVKRWLIIQEKIQNFQKPDMYSRTSSLIFWDSPWYGIPFAFLHHCSRVNSTSAKCILRFWSHSSWSEGRIYFQVFLKKCCIRLGLSSWLKQLCSQFQ